VKISPRFFTGGDMRIRWYRPDRASLSYALVRRVLEIKIWKAEVVLYWHR